MRNDSFGDVGAQFVCDSIIVEDITPPQTQALPDINEECSAVATIPTATDDYAGIIYGTTSDPLEYYEQGEYTIIWNFDDGNGNSIDIPQKVYIEDVTPPAINCHNDIEIVINNFTQTYSVETTELDVSCNDNCSIKYITNDYNNRNSLIGSTFEPGNTTIKWTVIDSVDNVSECFLNIDVETALNVKKSEKNNNFTIYPNPSNGNFVINTTQINKIKNEYSISIYNIKGDVVYRNYSTQKIKSINADNLSKGVYIIKIKNKDVISQKRLIIY
jgi:hypothetical protein